MYNIAYVSLAIHNREKFERKKRDVLSLNNERKTLSNLYDMNQIRNRVNARSFHRSNMLYSSSKILNE
jgi:hypothetical protein